MKSKYLPNQRRQSCNSKQSLQKINNKQHKQEVGNQSMVVKSLPKQSKSQSINYSITGAIDNISQLISFLSSAKINPDKEIIIIESLKSYLFFLKQHLKTNLIVIKPKNSNQNHLSHLKLNLYTKNNEINQIKNLNSQKYPNKILTTIENNSAILNQKSTNNKILKKPFFNKSILPQINLKLKKQQFIPQKQLILNQHQNKVIQKSQQKEQLIKYVDMKPQQQKRKLIRVKTQKQRDEKYPIEQPKINKVDPIKIIQKLKQKITSHETLINKLKEKVKQFENAALKNNQINQTNKQNVDAKQQRLQQKTKPLQSKPYSIKTSQQSTNDNVCNQKSQVDILKTQLKERQDEIISLWTVIHNFQSIK